MDLAEEERKEREERGESLETLVKVEMLRNWKSYFEIFYFYALLQNKLQFQK